MQINIENSFNSINITNPISNNCYLTLIHFCLHEGIGPQLAYPAASIFVRIPPPSVTGTIRRVVSIYTCPNRRLMASARNAAQTSERDRGTVRLVLHLLAA